MDRGFLLALMALEDEFVTRQQFLDGFQFWLADKSQKFDEILIAQAVMTVSQRDRLSTRLLAIQGRYQGEWEMAIAESDSVAMVYGDMIHRAQKDEAVLQMVKLIGEAAERLQKQDVAGAKKTMRIDSNDTIDQHATVLHDSSIDPFATITNNELEDMEE